MSNKEINWRESIDGAVFFATQGLGPTQVRNLQDDLLDIVETQIIEPLIEDYDEALSLEEAGYLTKDRVKEIKFQWIKGELR